MPFADPPLASVKSLVSTPDTALLKVTVYSRVLALVFSSVTRVMDVTDGATAIVIKTPLLKIEDSNLAR